MQLRPPIATLYPVASHTWSPRSQSPHKPPNLCEGTCGGIFKKAGRRACFVLFITSIPHPLPTLAREGEGYRPLPARPQAGAKRFKQEDQLNHATG